MIRSALVVLLGLTLMAAGTACRGRDGEAGDAKAGPGDDGYFKIEPQHDLGGRVGAKVKLEGRISNVPWQHMIRWPEGYPQIAYFDFELGRQTVLYSKSAIACPGPLTVWGTVLKIQGETKRPGSDEPVVEYHILVDRFECAR
jgi:hypothetical protein